MEEQLKQLFVELVRFTKTVSPEIWAILIRQQIIWGCMYIVSFILPIVGFLFGLHTWKTKPDWATDSDKDAVGGFAIMAVSSIVGVFIFLLILSKGLPLLLNPAYYALMSLKP